MRVPYKKILRITAAVLGGILLLLFLAAAGICVWLRTDSGMRTVADIAAKALAARGLFLKTETFSGPLPARLRLTGVSLADADGEWIKAREVDVRLNLFALFGNTAAVSLVRVDTPEIYRLPDLPPAGPETEPGSAPGRPGFFNLPVGVRLDTLSLENIRVYAPLVFAGAELTPGKPLFSLTVAGNAGARPGDPLNAAVSVDAAVTDMEQFASHAGQLPVDALSLHADMTAAIGEAVDATLTGVVTPEKNGNRYPLEYGATANLLADMLTLPEFFAQGLDLRLAGTGGYNLANGNAEAKATLTAGDGGEWENLAADLLGRRLGGGITLAADGAMDGGGTFSGSVDLAGTNMRWGDADLQKILGPTLVCKASGKGGKNAWTLDLATLSAGILGASGDAAYDALAGHARAALKGAVSDLSALLPEFAGALAMTADVSGPLDAPDFSLTIISDSIRHADGRAGAEFGGINASVQGKARLNAEKSARGTVSASLEKSPAGPVVFRTELAAARDARGTLTARLSDLALTLAGTDITADIETVLPEASPKAYPVITGQAAARIRDWAPLAALARLPISGGAAGFDARFSHDGREQAITADIRAESLAMRDAFSIRALAGNLEARGLAAPDIALDITTGKSEAGPLSWESGAAAVRAEKGAGSFALALRTDRAAQTALQTLQSASAPSRPRKGERLSASGDFSLDPTRVTLNTLAARLPDSPAGVYLASPATVSLGAATEVKALTLNVVPGKGSIACDARFSAAASHAAVTVTELPFRLVREISGAPLPDGALNAALVMTKNGSSVTGTAEAKATMTPAPAAGRKGANMPPVTFTLASSLDTSPDPNFPGLTSGRNVARLKGDATLGFAPGTGTAGRDDTSATPDARVTFNIPLRFSASGIPAPAEREPLGANLFWRGEVAPLWALLPMPDRTLGGMAQVEAHVRGALASPEYAASAYLAGGRFEDNILGLLLTKIEMQATSASDKASEIVLRAEDTQGGFAALQAALQPGDAGSGPLVRARGHINRLQPLHRDDLFLRLSGRFSANGPLDAANVNADIEIERGELSLLSTLGGGVRTLEISGPDAETRVAGKGLVLDATITIPHRFFIRGRGLDSEWRGRLAVTGPLSRPSLTGSLHPVRGTFDLLSRPFAFETGDITFFGGDRINPGLNLTLTNTGPNITAIVRATGTANKPQIQLDSRPSLPRDQVLAEVLFGKEFSRLSRFEALQVANSVRQLANIGSGGIDPLTSMRTALGVDMLRVGSGNQGSSNNRSISGAPGADTLGGGARSGGGDENSSAPSVEAGKYINDVLYVGVEQGITGDSTGVRVEMELRPNLTLQGRTSTRSNEIGIGWKRDY